MCLQYVCARSSRAERMALRTACRLDIGDNAALPPLPVIQSRELGKQVFKHVSSCGGDELKSYERYVKCEIKIASECTASPGLMHRMVPQAGIPWRQSRWCAGSSSRIRFISKRWARQDNGTDSVHCSIIYWLILNRGSVNSL